MQKSAFSTTILGAALIRTARMSAAVFEQYIYGDDCQSLFDDFCLIQFPDCTQCAMSWPAFDPAGEQSVDAKCRCKSPEFGAVKYALAVQYYTGGDCESLVEDECSMMPFGWCTRC